MKKLLDLSDVKKALQSSTITTKEASEYMLREDTQELIHQLVHQFDSGVTALDDVTLQSLVELVDLAYYIYTYSDEDTGMSDTEYDKLFEMLGANGKEEFVTLPLLELDNLDVEYHAYPVLRGTLSKVHSLDGSDKRENKSRKSLDAWIESTEKLYKSKTGKSISLKDEDVYVFPKWDGVSVIFEFDGNGNIIKALTRGYTKFNTAKNITQHFKDVTRKIMSGKSYGLKTEVLVREEDTLEYNQRYSKDYKQSRAIASGIVNSDEPDERDRYLVIMQLRYVEEGEDIEKLCPEVFDHPHIRCKLGDYDAIERFAQEHRYVEDLRCDGAVIHIIDPEIQKVLGRVDDKNRFEVAYKFTEEYEYSKVKDIEFQTGMLGRITPVVKIKPVKLKGNTISSASLSNMDRLRFLNLAKGDKIKILYDIIPYATIDGKCEAERSGNEPIRPKENCPDCGSKLVEKGAFLFCENPSCDCRIKGKILNYLVKMRIQDISYATIDTLYRKGFVTSIEDLYELEKHRDEIIELDGFGEATFANWLYQINSKKTVPEQVLFGALGIPGVSSKVFELVFSVYDVDDLIDIADKNSTHPLTEIKGIGDKKAKAIINGVQENKKLLKYLLKRITLTHTIPASAEFTVCFTKVRDKSLENFITEIGGATVDNVTMRTDYCVVPKEGVTSNSTKAAEKYGVPIITIDRLRDELVSKFCP